MHLVISMRRHLLLTAWRRSLLKMAYMSYSYTQLAAHDVVAGHALLIGAKDVLINEGGEPIKHKTDVKMTKICESCFGGAPDAYIELAERDWARVFEATAN